MLKTRFWLSDVESSGFALLFEMITLPDPSGFNSIFWLTPFCIIIFPEFALLEYVLNSRLNWPDVVIFPEVVPLPTTIEPFILCFKSFEKDKKS